MQSLLDSWIEQVQSCLAGISIEHRLFAATAWPAFIAAAESEDEAVHVWARHHFEKLWTVQPWGLVRGALSVLEELWSAKAAEQVTDQHAGWMEFMKHSESAWLIL